MISVTAVFDTTVPVHIGEQWPVSGPNGDLKKRLLQQLAMIRIRSCLLQTVAQSGNINVRASSSSSCHSQQLAMCLVCQHLLQPRPTSAVLICFAFHVSFKPFFSILKEVLVVDHNYDALLICVCYLWRVNMIFCIRSFIIKFTRESTFGNHVNFLIILDSTMNMWSNDIGRDFFVSSYCQ